MRSPNEIVTRLPRLTPRAIGLAMSIALLFSPPQSGAAQKPVRTLVAVFAHSDDEVAVAPMLARYAREGTHVYLIIATDGAQGGAHTDIPRGPELAQVRAKEAACSAQALGIQPPILLGFPDAKLGDYAADPSLLYRMTQRLHKELERLNPDALVTFGPDGATGHPDHRLVGAIMTQLVRAGAPGLPERLFYAWIPAEGMQTMNPQRGAPPMLVPQPKYLSVRVPFTPVDLDAAHNSMSCHRTQYPEETVRRVFPNMAATWNGTMPLAPAFSTAPGVDLFRFSSSP